MGKRPANSIRYGWIVLAAAAFLVASMEGAAAMGTGAEVLPPQLSVRDAPDPFAPVVATLVAGTHVDVLFTVQGSGGEWAKIVLPSEATGFVRSEFLRQLTASPSWRLANPGTHSPSRGQHQASGAWRIPLRRVGDTLLVSARINDQLGTSFIVDTGASVVSISEALADRLGIDYSARPKMKLITPAGTMVSPGIVLDSICVPDETGAGLVKVEAVVATLPKVPPVIGGLLGQTFLRHFIVTIEPQGGVMHLKAVPGVNGACH